MPSLLDIAPMTLQLQIATGNGDIVAIECNGLSVKSIAMLLRRFPALKSVLDSVDRPQYPESELDASTLVSAVPEAVAAILAAGTGHPGDPEHEEAAGRLYLNAQIDLLQGIIQLSAPQGIVPLVRQVVGMLGADDLLRRIMPNQELTNASPQALNGFSS